MVSNQGLRTTDPKAPRTRVIHVSAATSDTIVRLSEAVLRLRDSVGVDVIIRPFAIRRARRNVQTNPPKPAVVECRLMDPDAPAGHVAVFSAPETTGGELEFTSLPRLDIGTPEDTPAKLALGFLDVFFPEFLPLFLWALPLPRPDAVLRSAGIVHWSGDIEVAHLSGTQSCELCRRLRGAGIRDAWEVCLGARVYRVVDAAGDREPLYAVLDEGGFASPADFHNACRVMIGASPEKVLQPPDADVKLVMALSERWTSPTFDERPNSGHYGEQDNADAAAAWHNELYNLFAPVVHRAALHFGATTSEAETAVQHIMLKLWQHREAAMHKEYSEAYFWKAARRWVKDRRNLASESRPHLPHSEAEASAPALMVEPETGRPQHDGLMRQVEAIVRALPPMRRWVFWLCVVEGWTHREAAAVLGKTTKAIERHVARVRKQIRRRLLGIRS